MAEMAESSNAKEVFNCSANSTNNLIGILSCIIYIISLSEMFIMTTTSVALK